MPIDYSKYPDNWQQIRQDILERENHHCKWCDAQNYAPHPITGSRVILTIAHLGVPKYPGDTGDPHDKLDVRYNNLAALCQRCHLNWDRKEHAETRYRNKVQAIRESGQIDFLDLCEVE